VLFVVVSNIFTYFSDGLVVQPPCAALQVGHKRLFVEAPFASGDFADAWEHGVENVH